MATNFTFGEFAAGYRQRARQLSENERANRVKEALISRELEEQERANKAREALREMSQRQTVEGLGITVFGAPILDVDKKGNIKFEDEKIINPNYDRELADYTARKDAAAREYSERGPLHKFFTDPSDIGDSPTSTIPNPSYANVKRDASGKPIPLNEALANLTHKNLMERLEKEIASKAVNTDKWIEHQENMQELSLNRALAMEMLKHGYRMDEFGYAADMARDERVRKYSQELLVKPWSEVNPESGDLGIGYNESQVLDMANNEVYEMTLARHVVSEMQKSNPNDPVVKQYFKKLDDMEDELTRQGFTIAGQFSSPLDIVRGVRRRRDDTLDAIKKLRTSIKIQNLEKK